MLQPLARRRSRADADMPRRSAAFEIGWAYAAFGARLPPDAEPEIRAGFDDGRAQLKGRTLHDNTGFARTWLGIRLNGWRRPRIFDPAVTPEFLEQITPTHCPITRQLLTVATCSASDWSVERVANRGAYAPGNLIICSTKANIAKGSANFAEILRVSASGRDEAGLSPLEWARLAALTGIIEDPDSVLPLLVVPPPQMLIANRYTLLQVAVMYGAGDLYSRRVKPELRQSCHGKSSKRALDYLFAVAEHRLSTNPYTARMSLTQWHWQIGDAWADISLLRAFRAWVSSLANSDLYSCHLTAAQSLKWARRPRADLRDAWCEKSAGYIVREPMQP